MEELLLLLLAFLARGNTATVPVTPPVVTPPVTPPVVEPPVTPPVVALPPAPQPGEYSWSGEFVGTSPGSGPAQQYGWASGPAVGSSPGSPYHSQGGWVVPPLYITSKQCFLQTKYGQAYQLFCYNFNGDRLIGTTTEGPILQQQKYPV